jgi:CHRD domain
VCRGATEMLRRHLFILVIFSAVITAVASFGAGGALAVGGKTLTATLTGAAEVPGPGDPDGTGTAEVTINPGLKSVCYTLTWANLDEPVWGAHIHQGEAGTAGGVVVTLFGGPILPRTTYPGTFAVSDCVTASVSSTQLADILDNPTGYYVNIHTDEFPDGAIRGQLSKS